MEQKPEMTKKSNHNHTDLSEEQLQSKGKRDSQTSCLVMSGLTLDVTSGQIITWKFSNELC